MLCFKQKVDIFNFSIILLNFLIKIQILKKSCFHLYTQDNIFLANLSLLRQHVLPKLHQSFSLREGHNKLWICHNVEGKSVWHHLSNNKYTIPEEYKANEFSLLLTSDNNYISYISKIRKIPENGKKIQIYWFLEIKLNLILFELNAMSMMSKSEIVQIT